LLLASLVAATKQDDDIAFILAKVDPIAGAKNTIRFDSTYAPLAVRLGVAA